MFYSFIGLLPYLPYLYISLFRSTFPLNTFQSNVTQPTALSLPSGYLISHNFPSCLSLPHDCHLPLGGHIYCCSSVPLTVHGHERAAQYVLHVTLVGIFLLPPPKIFGPVSSCWILNFLQSSKQSLRTWPV